MIHALVIAVQLLVAFDSEPLPFLVNVFFNRTVCAILTEPSNIISYEIAWDHCQLLNFETAAGSQLMIS